MMNQDEVEELAQKSGMTPEEYCLERIDEWESMLSHFREEYRGLDDEEFQERIEN